MSPANKININWDDENDILYVLYQDADPDKTINIDFNEDVVVRFDPRTKNVVGFIIDNFSETFPTWKGRNEYELMEKFEILIEGLNNLHLAPAKS